MTTEIDSAGWTGTTGLTEAERHGDLTYEADTTRLRRHANVAAAIAFILLGFSIWTAANIDTRAPSLNDIIPAAATLLLTAWATMTRRWLLQRLTNTPKTAPLELRSTFMRMGAMPFDIPYASIETINLKRSDSTEELLARFAYPPRALVVRPPFELYELHLTRHPIPYVLDLDILSGDTAKIIDILNYRIQHAKL